MKIVIASILVSSIFFFTASNALAGLGISPSQMFFDNLSPGAHVEKTFVLSRDNYQEALDFQVSIEGTNKTWLSLDRDNKFTIPAGEQRFSVVVRADIPPETLVGDYSGGIRLVSSVPASTNTVTANNISAFIKTDFKIVPEQILEDRDSANSNKKSQVVMIIVGVGILFMIVIKKLLNKKINKSLNITIKKNKK